MRTVAATTEQDDERLPEEPSIVPRQREVGLPLGENPTERTGEERHG